MTVAIAVEKPQIGAMQDPFNISMPGDIDAHGMPHDIFAREIAWLQFFIPASALHEPISLITRQDGFPMDAGIHKLNPNRMDAQACADDRRFVSRQGPRD